MAGRGGRGEALRRLLEMQQKDELAKKELQPPKGPETEVKKSMGRGAIFARLMGVNECSEKPEQKSSQENENLPPGTSNPVSGMPSSFGRGRSFMMPSISQRDEIKPGGSVPEVKNFVPSPKETKAETVAETISNLSFEEKPPVIMKGGKGALVPVTCNYIRLKLESGKGVYEYEVKFRPSVDSKNVRFSLLNMHKDIIGETKTFDGSILYLPFQLPENESVLRSCLPTDRSEVEVRIIFKRRKRLGETIHLYNVLFRRIMNTLGLALLGRHFFDPSGGIPIPMHKLEVWPGYITAVDEFEGGIMLCCDASHRVLRTQTVYDLLSDLMQMNPGKWKDELLKVVIGQTVLTRYNNKLYKIDDVNFSCSVNSFFETRDGNKISYFQYYTKQYGISIKDIHQPLLISKRKCIIAGKEVSELVSLVPELCHMTGLTDSLKADMKVMKDIAQCTRISPCQRQYALKKYIKNVNGNSKAKSILESWGLVLEDGTIDLEGRILPAEDIYFGGNKMVKGTTLADWTKATSSNNVLSSVDLNDWLVICVRRDEKLVNEYIQMMKKCGPQVGMMVRNPKILMLPDDGTDHYIRTIRTNLLPNLQIIVVIFPSARSDKYAAIKKLCCSEIGIASQVIQTRTIRRPEKLRQIVLKIALQMNCKLGGTLWTLKIPMRNTMVCGIDTYHDPTRRGHSYSALVSSLNPPLTRWFSKICKQTTGKELMEGLTTSLLEAISKYHSINGMFPEQIVIFRDGVGDGQLPACRDFECPQFQASCQFVAPDYTPKILFVVVQKRINTRIFSFPKDREASGPVENPCPGTVIDHTITRRDWFDFFLVSQNVRQGTVSPTHYVVVYNSTHMQPDHIQRLSYKLTHLYYNWPGTIRVPAPCQYAHKLAYLVGESIHKEAVDKLSDKLYYL